MYILGISAFYHDSAAALIQKDEIIAAAQEERFTRKKHDATFPVNAIKYCLSEANITLDQVESIVFFEKPFLKFERIIETYLAFAPQGFRSFCTGLPVWVTEKLFQKKYIKKLFLENFSYTLKNNQLTFSDHHLSHAASAFFPSPFDEAIVLTMDGVGEWATTTLGIGKGNQLNIIKEISFPHSLGLLYSAFTDYIGFKVNSGEYKLMGLAPYGEPHYTEIIYKNLIDVKEDGTFRLNMKYFNYCTGLTMTNQNFYELFTLPRRHPEKDLLTQKHMDLAASIQKVLEEIVLKLVKSSVKETGIQNLCLAGGVALNCVANGKILKSDLIKNLWVQPAAGDAGGALGAALAYFYGTTQTQRVPEKKDSMKGSYLGPSYSLEECKSQLRNAGAKFHEFSEEDALKKCAQLLAEGNALGWFSGKMEFGPRALGARSIIADPRSTSMQKNLNLKVKFRESFRPFAPAVLREDVSKYFDLDVDSPYMLLVTDIQKNIRIQTTSEQNALFGIEKLNISRSSIPAVTHVDYSARIQTVHKETNNRFYKLIENFKSITNCSVLVNTSFNVRGEPIVCTPEDAFRCFMGSNIDVLVVENLLLFKNEQDEKLKLDYSNEFELD